MTPDLVIASCGAGVQSTAILLLAVDGQLPKPDAAIFADTGWEPRAVYDQVDRLEALCREGGIDFHRVSQGNLRRDAIDPDHRYASIPYYVKGPCTMCDALGEVAGLRLGPAASQRDVARLRSRLSAPAGSQPADWPTYTGVCPRCDGTKQQDGMGRRQCTSEYKLSPITRKIRELLGAKAPNFRRVPAGRLAEQWVGFSTDEVIRANRRKDSQGVSYLTTRYPLLDLELSRKDCEAYLAEKGWGHTVKSACIGCPFHGNAQWRDLRDNHPDEWADAVKFDAGIRKGGSRGLPLDGEAFLHRSRVPLDQAPIDRLTAKEFLATELSLFDLLEDGEPEGCSPYGCRSDDPSLDEAS